MSKVRTTGVVAIWLALSITLLSGCAAVDVVSPQKHHHSQFMEEPVDRAGLSAAADSPVRVTNKLPDGWTVAASNWPSPPMRFASVELIASDTGLVARKGMESQYPGEIFRNKNEFELTFDFDRRQIRGLLAMANGCTTRAGYRRDPGLHDIKGCAMYLEKLDNNTWVINEGKIADALAQVGGLEGITRINIEEIPTHIDSNLIGGDYRPAIAFLESRLWLLSASDQAALRKKLLDRAYAHLSAHIGKINDQYAFDYFLQQSNYVVEHFQQFDPDHLVPQIRRMQDQARAEFQGRQDVAQARADAVHLQRAKTLVSWRNSIAAGTETNCGPVVDARGTMAQIILTERHTGQQTPYWLHISELFPPDATCDFDGHGQYSPITDAAYSSLHN